MDENDQICTEAVFEFYLTSYKQIMEQLNFEINIEEESEQFEQTLEMDLDFVWNFALKILQIFDENVNSTCPSNFFNNLIFN